MGSNPTLSATPFTREFAALGRIRDRRPSPQGEQDGEQPNVSCGASDDPLHASGESPARGSKVVPRVSTILECPIRFVTSARVYPAESTIVAVSWHMS